LLGKEKSIKTMKASKTTRNNLQTVKMKWKQPLRIVSPKRLKKMIRKRKATTRIATLKALQSYSKGIQIRVYLTREVDFNCIKTKESVINKEIN